MPLQTVLRIECPDEKGLIYKITKVLADKNLNIISNSEFVDQARQQFFMRIVVDSPSLPQALADRLAKDLPAPATVTATTPGRRKLAILAGKESHCLGDLLIRAAFNELDASIACVISNHAALQDLTDKFNVPFVLLPVNNMTREDHEAQVLSALGKCEFDYLVLAKYMRILTPGFVEAYPNQILNIHHSFLPAFIGARPYHQAHTRGVKIIGATAHFVNNDLDDGPIIVQNIHRVTHGYTVEDLIKAGRDVEKATLAQALRLVLEDRVFVSGKRTIVFQ